MGAKKSLKALRKAVVAWEKQYRALTETEVAEGSRLLDAAIPGLTKTRRPGLR
jgi:hypothetical protein